MRKGFREPGARRVLSQLLCTREIREALLRVAIYCGIPASLDAHNIAMEVFAEDMRQR